MLETKIAKFATRLHKSILSLALSSLNRKDKSALKRLDADVNYAKQLRDASVTMRQKATEVEDHAHTSYETFAAEVNREYANIKMTLERV